jgi:hypothetical protein
MYACVCALGVPHTYTASVCLRSSPSVLILPKGNLTGIQRKHTHRRWLFSSVMNNATSFIHAFILLVTTYAGFVSQFLYWWVSCVLQTQTHTTNKIEHKPLVPKEFTNGSTWTTYDNGLIKSNQESLQNVLRKQNCSVFLISATLCTAQRRHSRHILWMKTPIVFQQ